MSEDMKLNDRVTENVRYIAFRRGLSGADLQAKLPVSRATFYSRLSGQTGWHVSELEEIAKALNVSVQSLLFTTLPHLDLNQEPSGYRLLPRRVQVQRTRALAA